MQHHATDHTLTFIQWLLIYLHLQFWHSRRSRIHKQPPEVFLKFFANFTGKHLCWSLFFTKLQAFRPATLLKIDSYSSVFLWNLRNSEEHLFWRTSERLFLCIDYFIIYWFLKSSTVHVFHFSQITFSLLSACDTDTYFENIQTILIFLKYYYCVSNLKYYKIMFFFMNN